jgi:hypothetical protein
MVGDEEMRVTERQLLAEPPHSGRVTMYQTSCRRCVWASDLVLEEARAVALALAHYATEHPTHPKPHWHSVLHREGRGRE